MTKLCSGIKVILQYVTAVTVIATFKLLLCRWWIARLRVWLHDKKERIMHFNTKI